MKRMKVHAVVKLLSQTVVKPMEAINSINLEYGKELGEAKRVPKNDILDEGTSEEEKTKCDTKSST